MGLERMGIEASDRPNHLDTGLHYQVRDVGDAQGEMVEAEVSWEGEGPVAPGATSGDILG